ncbi:Ubiquitin carboxyl-terminal hydrolase 32 [Bagarius yarrelli]|uniref:Ubiquitin carboxyl-terminal hydrolase 32 n=1 Tax=Bagarius yarrelli TaxID=175774 RepID=A0A556V284_BAGYA|nr:Ubiquitin carboxyl-terminal hydrolase 32 [Bagarius yarrelli]
MKRLRTFWNGKVTQQGTLARGGAETLLAGACSQWGTGADSLLPLIIPSVNHRAGSPKQNVQQPCGLLVARDSRVIYSSFGGTSKGLHFNNLIVGLVLLTRGRDEEKARYIFSLFASESGSYATLEDIEAMLQAVDGAVHPSLRKCFTEAEKVNYEKFKSWLLQNKDAFTFSRWLLSSGVCVTLTDDSDTPTFYQTLAGVTHLEESDIIDLEKRYWLLKAQSRTGRFDLETFVPLVSPPIHPSISEGLFHAFDENRDNHIDFKEISCGLSACCRGPLAERQKFCFKVFDVDRDGVLCQEEIHEMVVALLEVWKDNRTDSIPELQSSVSDIVDDILKAHDTTRKGHLTLEDYQIWSVQSALAAEFLNLLFQVCHIVLGLRPATPEEEGQIIRGWLERESRHGLQPGDYWFLISTQWWQQWKDYVKYSDNKLIVVEQPAVFPCSRTPTSSAGMEPGGQGEGATSSRSSPEERCYSDNISSASEASETPSGSQYSRLLHSSSTATDICFSRQTDSSEVDSQSFLGAHGNVTALRPGAIDNQPLVTSEALKAPTLTMEGALLRRSPSLHLGKDFEVVPEPVWRALYHWYGANLSLPRPVRTLFLITHHRVNVVIKSRDLEKAELELFPRHLLFLRQQPPARTPQSNGWMMGNMPSPTTPLKRVLAYTGCFSRNYLTLLDDEDHSLEALKIPDEQYMVIEVRNKDMSWPEEMSFLANSSRMNRHKVPTEKGATGLSNLGNTCFMNSSIQCVSNTKPLTEYFTSGSHLYELNRTNPIGMRGHMAKCYGDLIQELWSGAQKSIAPLKLRWTIAKYAPRFDGFQQQDSQELLAFLLDGLHEDLNRVHDKPYVELKDSDGRPDWEVASEAWENHLRRNRSIVVDLFHGQLRSQVKCKTCGHVSARFDPFNFLSLPLPMDNSMHLEIIVIRLDGSTPVRYGLRLNVDEKYSGLKSLLSELCHLIPDQILLVEIHLSCIKNFPLNNQKVRRALSGFLCAFEIPLPPTPLSDSSPIKAGSENLAILSNGTSPVVSSGTTLRLDIIPKGMPNTVVPCSTEGSPANGLPNGHILLHPVSPFIGYIIAIHRKMMRAELYFLSSQKNRPSLFGMPLIVPCTADTRGRDLYNTVWTQVSRLASPLPPQESSNHAQDCDDSLGYHYPFTLSVVQGDGNSCAWCPWYKFCRGCIIKCNDDSAIVGNTCIAVDWDPTALHLRYQTSQERLVEEHVSVERSRRAQAEPISLDSCLKAFTTEEELGENELYYCSKCKTHRLATKKLDIWRLPPILIVHLKRFQFVNNRWIKSQKIVRFPRDNFDPSAFLTPREVDRHQQGWRGELTEELSGKEHVTNFRDPPSTPTSLNINIIKDSQSSGRLSSSLSRGCSPIISPKGDLCRSGQKRVPSHDSRLQLSFSRESLDSGRESPVELEHSKQESQNEAEAPGLDSALGDEPFRVCDNATTVSEIESNGCTEDSIDLEGSQDQRDRICLEPVYDLYAISCHSGILGGGHYVTYAKNPNEKWYCYNDSSCKEVNPEEIDTDSAYILFYEQQGVDYSLFMPKTDGKKMADTSSMDEDFETDYKKYCVLQ